MKSYTVASCLCDIFSSLSITSDKYTDIYVGLNCPHNRLLCPFINLRKLMDMVEYLNLETYDGIHTEPVVYELAGDCYILIDIQEWRRIK